MSDDPVLQVSNLSVRFGDVLAVDDVSFTVGRGEVVAIVGESGCGKSVTAMSLLGLAGPTATVGGSARFGDLDSWAPTMPPCAACAGASCRWSSRSR